jgi:hypothetical protein
MSKEKNNEVNESLFTEEERKAIENKDKILLTKLILDYIN